jgi:hypothetical protein
VHRFHDWRLAERPDPDFGVFVGPSFDYDIETSHIFNRRRSSGGLPLGSSAAIRSIAFLVSFIVGMRSVRLRITQPVPSNFFGLPRSPVRSFIGGVS